MQNCEERSSNMTGSKAYQGIFGCHHTMTHIWAQNTAKVEGLVIFNEGKSDYLENSTQSTWDSILQLQKHIKPPILSTLPSTYSSKLHLVARCNEKIVPATLLFKVREFGQYFTLCCFLYRLFDVFTRFMQYWRMAFTPYIRFGRAKWWRSTNSVESHSFCSWWTIPGFHREYQRYCTIVHSYSCNMYFFATRNLPKPFH